MIAENRAKSLEDLQKVYTQGNCGVLATVLHQMFGVPVYAATKPTLAYCCYYPQIPDGFDIHKLHMREVSPRMYQCHAVVKQGKKFVDATGRFTESFYVKNKHQNHCDAETGEVLLIHSPDPDLFIRNPFAYLVCLIEDVPRLFPEFADRVSWIIKTNNLILPDNPT